MNRASVLAAHNCIGVIGKPVRQLGLASGFGGTYHVN